MKDAGIRKNMELCAGLMWGKWRRMWKKDVEKENIV